MEIKTMNIDELEARKKAIPEESKAEDADLDALEEELRSINAELEARQTAAAEKAEKRQAIAEGAGKVIKTFENVEERKTMTFKEVRNSKEYIDAYARYIVSEDDRECRSILTENAGGSGELLSNNMIPVPEMVDEIIGTAWEKNDLLKRVKKINFRGNFKFGYESYSSGAEVHQEGATQPSEESLILGIGTLIPTTIKKWISISDEAVDMGGEAFLRYVYDELTYRILKKLENEILLSIVAATTSAAGIFVPTIQAAPSTANIISALAQLTSEAANPVAVMSRNAWATIKNTALAANYAYDPFDGLEVVFNDSLMQFNESTGTAIDAMIIGDFSGYTVNYPAGEEVKIKYDDLTEAPADMVRVIGRQYVAYGITKPEHFVFVAPSSWDM